MDVDQKKSTFSIILKFKIYTKNFIKLLLNSEYYYAFYSEKKNYQSYYLSLINELLKKENSIVYLSSDINDYIDNEKIVNLYIGNGFLRYFTFAILKAKYFFMTTTDLNKNGLFKNKNIENYVYVFHCINSISMVYTETAFDNYDIICCIGDYHINEFKSIKDKKTFESKVYLKTGYFYFDYINENMNNQKIENNSNNRVLVAPSWNYSSKNLLELYGTELIEELLSKNYYTIFRPHQEHFKRNKHTLDLIKKKFTHHKNFIFDDAPFNFNSLSTCSYLITDYSGIAHEFFFLMKKPVLYFKELSKIHNIKFDILNGDTIEEQIFERFGYPLFKENLGTIEVSIKKSAELLNDKKILIENFANKNFYNFKNSAKLSHNSFN